MNIEQLMLLDPDDITFEVLDTSQLRELALARTYGDARRAISALGERRREVQPTPPPLG